MSRVSFKKSGDSAFILGICGGSGSGKSMLSSILEENGFFVLDADAIYRELLSTSKDLLHSIAIAFGNHVILEDGGLNRRELANIVFADSEKLAILNSLTHPAVVAEITSRISEYKKNAPSARIVIDAPLLYESGLNSLCDKVVALTASRDVRIARIIARDRISTTDAEARIDSQSSLALDLADLVINNDGSQEDLRNAVDKIIDDYNLKEI